MLIVGLIVWLEKDLPYSSLRPIITANLIGDLIGAVIALLATLNGVMNAAGWSAFGIYLLIALGFAYYQFMATAK